MKLTAPTAQDLADLEVAADCADMIGLSFAQSPADIEQLRWRLKQLGASDLGIVLRAKTRRAFGNLPKLLLAAIKDRAVGVMIARGDLAVERGYERLADVQEESRWACEAAHMPVIWATQVLESLAKTCRPSRSEITDAPMAERDECVVLNEGPFIVDAIRTLEDMLRRKQAHQSKKWPLLRALRPATTGDYGQSLGTVRREDGIPSARSHQRPVPFPRVRKVAGAPALVTCHCTWPGDRFSFSTHLRSDLRHGFADFAASRQRRRLTCTRWHCHSPSSSSRFACSQYRNFRITCSRALRRPRRAN